MRAFDDMRVRDDVAVGANDDAGSATARGSDEHAPLHIGDIVAPVSERDDLDDGRTDARRQRFERPAGLAEIVRGCNCLRPGLRMHRAGHHGHESARRRRACEH